MADLTFSQPARPNLLPPILLALAVALLAAFLVFHFTPHTTAEAAVTHTAVFDSHLVFKSESIVVGRDQAQDDVFVLTTVRITDRLRLPLFLKDFTATLAPADNDPAGNEPITTSAVEKPDLPNVYTTFPQIKALAASQAPPLFRETEISPGQTVEGTLLLHFPVPRSSWDHRKSASVSITLYHQPAITLPIPGP